ncbi:MAG: AraC family transcriptional regulator [Pseudomonadota bacterium]
MANQAQTSAHFRGFADNSGCSYEDTPFQSGLVWHSLRKQGEATDTQSLLPAGLHIGYGVASMVTSNDQFGEIEARGPTVTAMLIPEGGARFRTRSGSGNICSFGLHIADMDAIENDPCLREIADRMRDRKVAAMTGTVTKRLEKLRTAVDPWFQGETRGLMLQARAMELTAVVAQALDAPDADSYISPRDLRRAASVRELIDSDLSKTLRLEWLAEQTAIDTRAMTRLFRHVFGESIGEYIMRRRMHVASDLLKKGASVKAAAAEIGYHPNAFSTAYRRYFGYSPRR